MRPERNGPARDVPVSRCQADQAKRGRVKRRPLFRFIYSDDPECAGLRDDVRDYSCHWCLRALYGANYYTKGITP